MDRPQRLEPGFGPLLAAAFITNLGDGLRLAALPLLATTLTSSPLLISALAAAQFLPWATFAPIGGVIVDRADRRQLIVTTQAWRALIMVLLTLAVVIDAVQIWHLFVVAFLLTVGEILVDPSVVATVPTIVAPANLDRANSRLSTVEIVTNNFAGSPIGAATFALAPWLPFLLDGLSYLGSIGPFSRLPANRAPDRNRTAGPALRAEVGAGLRWILGHRFLRPLTIGLAVFHLGTAGASSLLVLIVTDVLDAPDITFGIVLSAAAVGAAVTSASGAYLTDRVSRRTVVTTAAAVTALSVVAAGLVTADWQLIAVWAVNGAAGGLLLSIGRGFVQRHTPNDRLGRAAIATRMITRTSFVFGALLAGTVASTTSIRSAFVVAGALHALGSGMVWRAFRHDSA